ncbi:NUDIX hydrolase [Acetobacter tropicalis]|nr:NUDIX hydrolase [Acetobacter tropicalis]KAA8388147.1 NUDIX hydrolase [Acetobacter tropicalis]KAA8390270.1 NUDIX hydrolase [Acetobacter tropicalis]KXV49853.1 ADP-ribose pyrophosphatase [Acetobacter tropicalis]MBC9007438.1 NUDIX hydrolase [Acetobacter tropicalis]MDO8171626.1 NUDIX hydrolase [Acetobacter tropicalis]
MTTSSPDAGGYLVLSSRIAYENPWTRVREDIIRRPNGKDGLYGVVERGQFVVILPLGRTDDGKPTITLVNQYRYPIGKRMWELPMGMWESRPDASPADVAAGELREETGLIARTMHHAGEVYQGAGYSTQKGHVYLATDLTPGPTNREDTEQDMTCHTLLLEEVEEMIRKNQITCMVSLAAFGMLRAQNLI